MKNRLLTALALAIVLLFVIVAAAGCSSEQPAGGGDDVLVMGTNAGFIPFEFFNENDEFDGFDIELAREIATIMGKELQIQDMDFGGLVLAVKNGQIDIAVAGMTITEERLEEVNFSDPYYVAGQTIVIREDETGIQGIDDLAERTVGVQEGTTGDFECDYYIEEGLFSDENVRRFQQVNEVFIALGSGQVDAVIIDEPVANRYIDERGGMKTIGGIFTEEEFGIAVAKENSELLAAVNDALRQIKESGRYEELYTKWFIDN